ncbi:MAG: hypothetical protein AAFS10_16145, partial [Myxococcota bacterium]
MNPSASLAPDTFAALPLDTQLEHLHNALDSQHSMGAQDLLQLCASVRDHAPLAWLCARLLEQSWLADNDARGWFAAFVIGQPETAVDKVIKAMLAASQDHPIHRAHLAQTLTEMLRIIPLERLSSLCLIDRALKHNISDVRDAHLVDLTTRCHMAIAQDKPLSLAHLAQLPTATITSLREAAAQRGPDTAQQLETTLHQLARASIAILGQAPKAVSQANAEELLSRRVYTDPGHFLIELLQNAEDAEATCWRLLFEARRVVVWHNGTPFNTKDVVGVTSIGQTTKRKQQIGFFGVGFKSVYEVTDRPQIYSDVYQFEIADVSIPKVLLERPAELPQEGTVLVLPLRDPSDPVRSPQALFAKARALDPVVLFTLRNIKAIELELRLPGEPPQHHIIRESLEDNLSAIRQEPEGWVHTYAVQDDEYHYDGGRREAGRADRTLVMVGVRLDDDRIPRPLDPEDSTLYSYLPTAEHSGLRFFIQGHFDVPVDRERLTPDSPWNTWILTQVPTQLARLGTQIIGAQPTAQRRREIAQGLLHVLPLESELGPPILRSMLSHLPQAFATIPLVPCTDGQLHAPPSVFLPENPALAALFEGQPTTLDHTWGSFIDPDLEPRQEAIARALGAHDWDANRLVHLLDALLEPLDDGQRCLDPAAPLALREPTL